ncbi:TadE/TadG family type IV pilus assembly protein [Mesorhizobium sp. ORM6]
MERPPVPISSDDTGVAAVEFALVLPFLCVALLGILDGWSYVTSSLSMRAGVKTAANLIMEGSAQDLGDPSGCHCELGKSACGRPGHTKPDLHVRDDRGRRFHLVQRAEGAVDLCSDPGIRDLGAARHLRRLFHFQHHRPPGGDPCPLGHFPEKCVAVFRPELRQNKEMFRVSVRQ